jgi:methanol dehydrogenase (cytochrome c) subunit 2
MSQAKSVKVSSIIFAGSLFLGLATTAMAYDGTKCVAPGNCWEPKPGFPEKIAGTKYDPKHNPKEIAKQSESIAAMEERNKKRVENFKKTGKFVYEVSKIGN